ncbi:MAG: hypothetical protein IPP37_20380 [Saprospiraceae bacterium]|nr:hypothetical protein [Saprospiraceae bacterium]
MGTLKHRFNTGKSSQLEDINIKQGIDKSVSIFVDKGPVQLTAYIPGNLVFRSVKSEVMYRIIITPITNLPKNNFMVLSNLALLKLTLSQMLGLHLLSC